MPKEIEDLSEILSASVETSNSTVSDFIQPVAEETFTDTDDFEEPEVVETGGKPEPEIPLTKEALKRQGKRWIGLIDQLQKPFLVKAYAGAILKPGDSEKLAHYQKTADLNSEKSIKEAIANDDSLYSVLKRFEEYKEACKSISFTEDEKEMIAEPLAEVLEKYRNMHMSPEMALLAAVAMVMLPRISPLFPKLFKGVNL